MSRRVLAAATLGAALLTPVVPAGASYCGPKLDCPPIRNLCAAISWGCGVPPTPPICVHSPEITYCP